ncbi:MAG: GNAT family N-acetyltransferase [Flavobacteriales bacterium]|nr:GNAT family N-acetyltransferase [Flavobacteriia bacterium]NCP05521.1 GNAT family N-acetyltransferase [Flavobacteriales bacterium]PIV92387.1 MAG: GNAT family N-acetyltransferase [Flavobacteriaceae bacterium CG17_big_fil_post_rev_8_21_14_2_50_33_15]PIY11785.1 MAG: GNAT family N-acetyltransferase [Flavobacteriaceae bacterium CG_4_10_14_3_um_filter_33_47]PJB16770.1 MAG: GNAT family N-acetyltransferase [Flavobacteriaceae bacterium CG_4_9_14_3_um_filter_33_16]
MEFTIRSAHKNDMKQVFNLINELAIFEKEPDEVELTVSDLENDGFGEFPLFHCFVAEANGNIEGLALVYNRYSTWKGKALHLEDLIVSEKMRGSGIGSKLLDEVVKYGYQLGVKRINWEVLDWNTPAIDFYLKKGAHIMRDWKVVHLNEQAIKNYIKKL